MIIRIPEALLFESGSAVLTNSSGLAFLKRLTLEFDKLPETALIKAVGHTDNVPMRENPIFADNLELSIARGVNVAQLIISEGISKERVLGGGEGEFSPIASNKIPELRAKNRRVDLYIYSIGEDLPSLAQNLAKSN
nr:MULTISPECIES: OmpA family protein [Helicobacter]